MSAPMIEAMAKAICEAVYGFDADQYDEGLNDREPGGFVDFFVCPSRRAARAALAAQERLIAEAMSSDSGTSDGEGRQADARIANKAIQVSRTEFFDYRPKE